MSGAAGARPAWLMRAVACKARPVHGKICQAFTLPPQCSQQPVSSGIVEEPHHGQITGAFWGETAAGAGELA